MKDEGWNIIEFWLTVLFYLGVLSVFTFAANWRFLPTADPAYDGLQASGRVLHGFYGYHLQHWDAGWYKQISEQGYYGQAVSFFPAYPLLVHAVELGGLDFPVASSLVSLAVTLVGLYYFYKFALREMGDSRRAIRAVRWLLIFPTSFFLFAPYTEGLFFALLMIFLYYLNGQRYLYAALAALAIALTRITGVLVVVLVVGELVRHWHEHAIRQRLIGLIAAPFAGLIGYMVYLQAKFGDAFAFLHQQASWDRNITLTMASFVERLSNYIHEFQLVFSTSNLAPIISRLTDVTFLIGGIIITVLIFARWRKDYGLWMLSMIAMPLMSGTLLGMPRFVLPLPFTYLFLAKFVKNETVIWMLMFSFAACWLWLLVQFSRGYWVA